jgi:hypothetical protein
MAISPIENKRLHKQKKNNLVRLQIHGEACEKAMGDCCESSLVIFPIGTDD